MSPIFIVSMIVGAATASLIGLTLLLIALGKIDVQIYRVFSDQLYQPDFPATDY